LTNEIEKLGLILEPERKFNLLDLGTDTVEVFEATLMPRSSMIGKSLRQLNFRDRYDLTALALWCQLTRHILHQFLTKKTDMTSVTLLVDQR